jgi:hypothetical protein
VIISQRLELASRGQFAENEGVVKEVKPSRENKNFTLTIRII